MQFLRKLSNSICVVDPKMKSKLASVHSRSSAIASVPLRIPTLSCSRQLKASGGGVGFSTRESQLCKNFTALAGKQHLPCTPNISAGCKSALFSGSILI